MVAGIIYAVDKGANIINISAGSKAEHQIVTQAINYATEKKIIVVAAAGDFKENKIIYPARNENVISIQAGSKLKGKYIDSNTSDDIDYRISGEEIKSYTIGGDFFP